MVSLGDEATATCVETGGRRDFSGPFSIFAVAMATVDAFALLPSMMLSIDDAASLACSCFNTKSLWHLEHMFMVAALPKNPQLLMQSIGASGGASHPVSLWSILEHFSARKRDDFVESASVIDPSETQQPNQAHQTVPVPGKEDEVQGFLFRLQVFLEEFLEVLKGKKKLRGQL